MISRSDPTITSDSNEEANQQSPFDFILHMILYSTIRPG